MKSELTLVALLVLGFVSFAQARDIAVTDLPAPVVAAVKKAHPGCKQIKAEEEHEAGAILYEVKIELKDKSRLELDVRPDGTIVETKKSD